MIYASIDRSHRRRPEPFQAATHEINSFLDAEREDWHLLTLDERIERVRAELLFLADPVSALDENDHDTLAGYTLGELYHARMVFQRWLRVLGSTQR